MKSPDSSLLLWLAAADIELLAGLAVGEARTNRGTIAYLEEKGDADLRTIARLREDAERAERVTKKLREALKTTTEEKETAA